MRQLPATYAGPSSPPILCCLNAGSNILQTASWVGNFTVSSRMVTPGKAVMACLSDPASMTFSAARTASVDSGSERYWTLTDLSCASASALRS